MPHDNCVQVGPLSARKGNRCKRSSNTSNKRLAARVVENGAGPWEDERVNLDKKLKGRCLRDSEGGRTAYSILRFGIVLRVSISRPVPSTVSGVWRLDVEVVMVDALESRQVTNVRAIEPLCLEIEGSTERPHESSPVRPPDPARRKASAPSIYLYLRLHLHLHHSINVNVEPGPGRVPAPRFLASHNECLCCGRQCHLSPHGVVIIGKGGRAILLG